MVGCWQVGSYVKYCNKHFEFCKQTNLLQYVLEILVKKLAAKPVNIIFLETINANDHFVTICQCYILHPM